MLSRACGWDGGCCEITRSGEESRERDPKGREGQRGMRRGAGREGDRYIEEKCYINVVTASRALCFLRVFFICS